MESLVQLMLSVKQDNVQVAHLMSVKINQLAGEELHCGVMLQARALQSTLDRDQANMGSSMRTQLSNEGATDIQEWRSCYGHPV